MLRHPESSLERALADRGYGWFVRAADDAFAYLIRDFGYELVDALAHFRGTFVRYRREHCWIVVELDPESNDMRVDLNRSDAAPDSERHAWDLLAERAPAEDWIPWPRQRGLSRDQVIALLQRWATACGISRPMY